MRANIHARVTETDITLYPESPQKSGKVRGRPVRVEFGGRGESFLARLSAAVDLAKAEAARDYRPAKEGLGGD